MGAYRRNVLVVLWLPLFWLGSSSAQSDLSATIMQDNALQDAVILSVRNALGAREQTTVVRRNPFEIEVRFYIATYRDIHNTTTLDNIQKRYESARSALLEPRLPESIADLIAVLEQL